MFSQFTTMLDILEVVLDRHAIAYLRIDGSTPVEDRFVLLFPCTILACFLSLLRLILRQSIIDEYTENSGILVFLLSTRVCPSPFSSFLPPLSPSFFPFPACFPVPLTRSLYPRSLQILSPHNRLGD